MLYELTFPPWILYTFLFIVSMMIVFFIIWLVFNIRRQTRFQWEAMSWLLALPMIAVIVVMSLLVVSVNTVDLNSYVVAATLPVLAFAICGSIGVLFLRSAYVSISKEEILNVANMVSIQVHRLMELVMPRRTYLLPS